MPAGETFKEVLQVVLTVAGVSIAVFGFGIYGLVSQQIESKVAASTERRYRISMAYQRLSVGMAYWHLFRHYPRYTRRSSRPYPVGGDIEEDPAEDYIRNALDQTRRAYEEHAAFLDEKERDVEQLLCNIRNNWAWFISEKLGKYAVTREERAKASAYVTYLRQRLGKCPSSDPQYFDTIETVSRRLDEE